jgi:peptide/nickel transport system substrate-binding protein
MERSLNLHWLFRKVIVGIAAVIILLWLKPGAVTGAGKTLSVAVPCNLTTFDPMNMITWDAWVFTHTIFENLVEEDENGQLKPVLAKSLPKVSDDRLTYWFELRNDVYFQNGQKFTAEDVKYSYDYILNPANKALRRNVWTKIRNIVVESPTRVRFEMHSPFGPWLRYMDKYMGIFPKGSREKYGDAFFKTGPEGMGTGPGIFVKAVPNDYVEYKRNPRYWRQGVPDWERLIIRSIPEEATRVAYLMTNQVQIISAPAPQEYVRLKEMPGITGDRKLATGCVIMIIINHKKPPFDDLNFRKAVSLGIDRKTISEKVFYGMVDPAAILAPPGAWYYNKQLNDLLTYNMDKAKECLQKSKYPTGTEFEILMPAQPYVMDVRDAGLVIQSQLAKIGIKVNLRILETSQLAGAVFRGETTAVFMPAMFPDPIYCMYYLFHPNGILSKAFSYENPELATTLEESYRCIGREELKPIFDKILGILAEDSVVITVGFPYISNLWRSEIKGFKVNPGLTIRCRDVILK